MQFFEFITQDKRNIWTFYDMSTAKVCGWSKKWLGKIYWCAFATTHHWYKFFCIRYQMREKTWKKELVCINSLIGQIQQTFPVDSAYIWKLLKTVENCYLNSSEIPLAKIPYRFPSFRLFSCLTMSYLVSLQFLLFSILSLTFIFSLFLQFLDY